MNNNFLNITLDSIGGTIAIVLTIAVALIAVLRFGVRFDLNEFLRDRKNRHVALARSYCPHIRIEQYDENRISIESLFVSPSGTLDWQCTQCGIVVHVPPSEEEIQKSAQYYATHYDQYRKKLRSFEKHARKSF